MTPFELIEIIYQKTPLPNCDYDTQICFTVSKYLSMDPNESSKVKRIMDYIFYIEPKHYIYLLYLCISKNPHPPYLKITKSKEKKPNKILEKVQYILNWTNREMQVNDKLLSLIFKDEKKWKQELAIK